MIEQNAEREHPVTPLELFFDLVFVFGFTQVTTVLSNNPTWSGLGHGLLILATLWWAWAAYAWLTNTVDPGLGLVWAAVLVAMGAMFVAALAVPDAFGSHGVVFGVSFLIVTVMHLTLYALAARGDRDLLTAILRIAPWSLAGAALIIAAGFVDGGTKTVLWLAAIVVGFIGPLFTGVSGWRVQPAHFVERHGLIVIIAIGESLVAIGLGERSVGLSTGVIVAAVLGFLVATSFWLAYFDFFQIRGQQLLADRSGLQRTALARDIYTYLHLPMVAGFVLFAFSMKTTLAHVGDELDTIPGARALRRPCALSARLRRPARAHNAHARPRAPCGRDCLRGTDAGSDVGTCARRVGTRGGRVGRTPRLRDHLVARGSRGNARTPRAYLGFLTFVARRPSFA
ncbi:MAG: low temperature requirement protein A [Gaiellaceae bacterium]